MSISFQMVVATALGHKLGSVAMQERSVCENIPLPVSAKPQFAPCQNIRAGVRPVHDRELTYISIEAPAYVRGEANGVAGKVWSASLEEMKHRPNFVHLATLMPDGSPHSAPVWIAREGDLLLICAEASSVKGKNTQGDPRVSMSIVKAHPMNSDHQWRLARCASQAQGMQSSQRP
jgi:hypothetical protein